MMGSVGRIVTAAGVGINVGASMGAVTDSVHPPRINANTRCESIFFMPASISLLFMQYPIDDLKMRMFPKIVINPSVELLK